MRSPSYIRNAPPKKRKRYNTHRIKLSYSYTVQEICELFGLHKNTVRFWIKNGLQPIDSTRPILIHGAVLKAFLDAKQKKRKQKCAFNQCYCFKCRCPQESTDRLANLTFKTDKIAHLSANCAVCNTLMNRNIRCADIPKFQNALVIQMQGEVTLYAPTHPRLNSDFRKDANQC